MTVSKLRKPTAKQAYNKIVKHFSQPGAQLSRSDENFGRCWYRHPGGKRACAVGCLLPDDVAHKCDNNVNGSEWLQVVCEVDEVKHWRSDQALNSFLAKAQMAHDNAGSVREFLYELGAFKP